MVAPDRKNALAAQSLLTGIDFVAVHGNQTTLDVYFMREPSALVPPLALTAADVTITGEDDPEMPIVAAAFAGPIDGRTVLRVTTGRPGGFGRYWLSLAGTRIDPFFQQIEINFKAACPKDVDCEPAAHLCPAEPADDILVDGSARDFWSLRRALLDFANLRNPKWKDRLEADVGVMVIELMAALGDELAYYQDRASREARFETAEQRRSLRRHVRLVDYDLHDGLGARGWIAIEAAPNPPGFLLIPAGTDVWARSDGGRTVGFEIGNGLGDVIAGVTVRIHAARNKIGAHIWDADDPDAQSPYRPLPTTCLPVGATSMYLKGHHAAHFSPGEHVFLVTEPPIDQRDMPIRRLLVTLTEIADQSDPLGGPTQLATEVDVTRIAWREPLPFEMNIEWLSVLGNAAPVTAGVTQITDFSIGPNTQALPVAIERVGADRSIAFLHTLPDVNGARLVRLGADPRASAPEIDLVELTPPSTEGPRWIWRNSLVGSNSSEPQDAHFTLDDGTWDRTAGFQRLGGEVVHFDYLTGQGSTIRFGDGEFGRMPARGNARPGEDRFFRARYRLGNGASGNLPAGTLHWADETGKKVFADFGMPILSVTNPLPTSGGVEPETLVEALRDAPEAFRAVTYRAVRPEDFDELAQRLPWVQRAGTQFRWTGSWMTAFTTGDPRKVDELPANRRLALARYLDRYRMAGREVHVLEPRYVDLDLEIEICVEAESYPADVVAEVILALVGRHGVRPIAGFFHPDHFTFGTPLDRSELEARVQRVPGVRAVETVRLRRLGFFPSRPFKEPFYQPGLDEVIRVENDPRHPDRGSIHISPKGGA
jgi:hypothetical protein